MSEPAGGDLGLQEPVIAGSVTHSLGEAPLLSWVGHPAFAAESHLSGNQMTWPHPEFREAGAAHAEEVNTENAVRHTGCV